MMEIVIIGGFLGSGKTTTLNYLIREAQNSNKTVAVLMNEFGERSVDTFLIDEDVQVNEIVNGCICCQMKNDVAQQLHDIYIKFQPDIIFIECSGIAHPIEVLDACLTPVLAPYSKVVSILGILDANLYNNLKSFPEDIQSLVNKQIKYCSDVLFNKTDLVNTKQLLQSLNYFENAYPKIHYFITTHGQVSINNIKSSTYNSRKNIKNSNIHHQNIGHILYNCEFSWNKKSFIEWLKTLPPNIYRVKGFLNFKKNNKNSIIQYSNNHLNIESTPLNMKEYLVIIGYNIDYDKLITSINKYKTS
ncbi:GTP-binding protein [Staphylococcus aureus]